MLQEGGRGEVRVDALLAVAHGREAARAVGELERAGRVRLGLEERDQVVEVAAAVPLLAGEHDEVAGKVVRGVLAQRQGRRGDGRGDGGEGHLERRRVGRGVGVGGGRGRGPGGGRGGRRRGGGGGRQQRRQLTLDNMFGGGGGVELDDGEAVLVVVLALDCPPRRLLGFSLLGLGLLCAVPGGACLVAVENVEGRAVSAAEAARLCALVADGLRFVALGVILEVLSLFPWMLDRNELEVKSVSNKRTFILLFRHVSQPIEGFPQYTMLITTRYYCKSSWISSSRWWRSSCLLFRDFRCEEAR